MRLSCLASAHVVSVSEQKRSARTSAKPVREGERARGGEWSMCVSAAGKGQRRGGRRRRRKGAKTNVCRAHTTYYMQHKERRPLSYFPCFRSLRPPLLALLSPSPSSSSAPLLNGLCFPAVFADSSIICVKAIPATFFLLPHSSSFSLPCLLPSPMLTLDAGCSAAPSSVVLQLLLLA